MDKMLQKQGWYIDDSTLPKWRVFYKPNGETMKLPCDAYSLPHYLEKGFTLEPPKEVKPMESVVGIADKEDSEETKVAKKPVKKRSVRAKHKRKTKET